MSQLRAKQDYHQAAGLREATFALLEQHAQRGGQDSDQEVVTALQDAANCLGAAERALSDTMSLERSAQAATNGGPGTSSNGSSQALPVSAAATITLALAETLVPLAASRVDEAERWLRIMREHGHVGNALAELGMASRQLSTPAAERRPTAEHDADPVKVVTEDAAGFALERNAPAVSTLDVLFAVILDYGKLFDRALYSATSQTRSDLLTALSQPEPVLTSGSIERDASSE
jgi:hypothetical protein